MVNNKKITLMVIALVVICIIALTALYLSLQKSAPLLPVHTEITSSSIRTGLVALDYTAWVDVSIHNYGGPGTVVVWVQVRQGTDKWTKAQTIYMNEKGSRELTFEFKEVGFWTVNTITYSAWID